MGLFTVDLEDEAPPQGSELDRPATLSHRNRKVAFKTRQIPVLDEDDIKESFVRGSGPGGQAINKTNSSVSLIHLPTGIRVQCQETRSLEQNRVRARKILTDRLDQLQNPGVSRLDMKAEKERARKRQRAKKHRRKQREKGEESEEPQEKDGID